jgi:hypothetical protein
MTFVSARILTDALDGVNGYENVTDADGTPLAIRITGQIVDDEIPQPFVTTTVIDGTDLSGLPPATPGVEDTPKDARYQAIMSIILRRIKVLHTQWRLTWFASRATDTGPIVTPKDPGVVDKLPTITAQMLTLVP